MKNSTMFTNDSNRTQWGRGIVVMVTLSCLIMASCSETGVHPTETTPEIAESFSSNQPSPSTVLSGKAAKFDAKGAHVMTDNGFVSPLFGLATAPNGDILVADAGAGVTTLSGAAEISLPGVTDIGPLGRSSMWATTGAGEDPEEDTGQALYRVSQGKNQLIVNLFTFEEENNPHDATIDSNPFDVQALGGGTALVADAGGNDLLRVSKTGQVEVLAIFPDEEVSTDNIKDLVGCPDNSQPLCNLPSEMDAQPVSTSIAIGPDGYYYVGELKGFPAPTGASNIWKVSPDASWAECGSSPDCVKVFDGGFTSIIDLAFDENGILHVAEIDERSWFAVEFLDPSTFAGGTINACNIDTKMCNEVATRIPILTAITFGNDDTLWATKNALVPGLAEVIEIP